MTIPIAGSVWPKVFGVLGILAGACAVAYTNSFVQIGGIPAYAFFTALSLGFNSAGTFISRQDNKSSEDVGAKALPITQSAIDDFKAQIAELAKKLEDKK